MQVEHHDLAHELPEFKDRIHELKTSDAHFHKQFERYDELTKEVERLEKQDVPITDEHLEELKKERLAVKDELYGMLKG